MMNIFRNYLATGKTIAGANSSSQMYETSRLLLHRIVTGYGPNHYITYSLFKKPFSINRWREYVDKRDFCKILFDYNKKEHFKVLEDKVHFSRKCQDYRLPHPAVSFTVNYSGSDSIIPNFEGPKTTMAFSGLADGNYIVKTCGGSYGLNLWSINKTATTIIVHNDHSVLTAAQFADRLLATKECYLVQKKIEVAHSLRKIMPGLACGSLRVNSFVRPDGSVVAPYVWMKLTTIGPVCDNFAGGDSGNMLAVVDLERECISRVVRKSANGLLTDITCHPDTGVDLRDYPLPELSPALELALQCGQAFADIPAVGWDIVVTDQGAMVLEGNPMFDPVGPQFCADRGIRRLVPDLLEE